MTGEIGERLLFVIGAPRSGTTMLMRMLNTHDDIYTRPEPHLLTPLANLGYYAYVDKATYDPYQAHQATRQFVHDLPNQEQDYLDALRAYTDVLYGRMLNASDKRIFVDKTPAYALELPFIAKLYPQATYVVLTRHPFAIFSSFAASFFDDDWSAAHEHNPVIERYIPAIARFLRESTVPYHHVKYEALVQQPTEELEALCKHAKLDFDPAMVHYGKKKLDATGLGDPIGVKADTKPNTKSLHKWTLQVANNPERLRILERALDYVSDEDLEALGYTRESLWAPLRDVDADKAKALQTKSKKWDRYRVERRLLVNLRKGIQQNTLGSTLRKVRFYCDVLLRDTWSDTIDKGPS